MNPDNLSLKFTLSEKLPSNVSSIYIVDSIEKLTDTGLSAMAAEVAKRKTEQKVNAFAVSLVHPFAYIIYLSSSENKVVSPENVRSLAHKLADDMKQNGVEQICISNYTQVKDASLHAAEGLALSFYQFLPHKTDKSKQHKLNEIILLSAECTQKQVDWMHQVVRSVYMVRNLVNEPFSHLNSEIFAQFIQEVCSTSGIAVENFDKAKIESLRMGGLLAVNQGSIYDPVFSVMEYRPANSVNKKPLILVGKGVVYDTGGLGLKPTTNSMDYMKSDMAGAAIVVGVMAAIARLQLPLYVVGVTPITDNWPGPDAYTNGDVITISDGTTVEVLHTDAEGRLILADALHYAKKYDPELVIDFATLTGSALRAVGKHGIVGFKTCSDEQFKNLSVAGNIVHERIVEFPLWDEYGDEIKSEIADIKNLGGENAGAITAAKFLQHFTSYPWVHLDIAGPAYTFSNDSYRGKLGTGVGVRLILEFLKLNYNLN